MSEKTLAEIAMDEWNRHPNETSVNDIVHSIADVLRAEVLRREGHVGRTCPVCCGQGSTAGNCRCEACDGNGYLLMKKAPPPDPQPSERVKLLAMMAAQFLPDTGKGAPMTTVERINVAVSTAKDEWIRKRICDCAECERLYPDTPLPWATDGALAMRLLEELLERIPLVQLAHELDELVYHAHEFKEAIALAWLRLHNIDITEG